MWEGIGQGVTPRVSIDLCQSGLVNSSLCKKRVRVGLRRDLRRKPRKGSREQRCQRTAIRFWILKICISYSSLSPENRIKPVVNC